MVNVVRHENGPRVYFLNKRVHHGLTGIIGTIICLYFNRWVFALPFVSMIIHDRKDFPFTDKNNH